MALSRDLAAGRGRPVTLAFGDQRARQARWAALATSLLTLAACVPLYADFANGTAQFQFVERVAWIPALHSQYYLGWTASRCR